MKKITPFLWFNNNAEEAVNFYLSIFKNSKIKSLSRYSEGTFMPVGTVMTVDFELDGQEFVALNGGPMYSFTEAISFVVDCESQEEVDHYWYKLSEGGQQQPCGWLKDKYGVSWQIVPRVLLEMLKDPDQQRAQRVTTAMLKMGKIDIAILKQAYDA
jgi:predicted 3-demethylubiquinone-9 3-methyltransferase (glyoxalase superfamily)